MITLMESLKEFGAAILIGSVTLGVIRLRNMISLEKR